MIPKRSVVIILFILPTIIYTQTTFSPQKIIYQNETLYPTAENPSDIYAADLDGDGDLDVLSASENDNKIAWYENTDGMGTFGSQRVISMDAVMAKSVFAIDLDGDGDLDVLSASEEDNKIAWYENVDGSGEFGAQNVISTSAEGAQSVYADDLDGDGDMDVLSASHWRYVSGRTDKKIAWYENTDGECTFGAQNVIDEVDAYDAKDVRTLDLDNDGDPDVICALDFRQNGIVWYENDGSGNFGDRKIIDNSAQYIQSIFTADFNGDGYVDILTGSNHYNDGCIAWYENDGTGAFQLPGIIIDSSVGVVSVTAADLDGDGDIDVISAPKQGNEVVWYENDGSGIFGVQIVISESTDEAKAVFAADLNGDDKIDVLSASDKDHKISWYGNDGTGDFGIQQHIVYYHDEEPEFVCTSDLDNDGDMDVISAFSNDDKLTWHENYGDGIFSEWKMITDNINHPTDINITDFDDDGDKDILSVSHTTYNNMITTSPSSKIVWIENYGTGLFSEPMNIADTERGRIHIYSGDIDGDNNPDVLAASRERISWFNNSDGTGMFGPQNVISTDAQSPSDITAADLNGDNAIDVLWSTSSEITWQENDGSGLFREENTISVSTWGARSVYPTDLDGDGDLDVLYASAPDKNIIAWWQNDGSGNFDCLIQIEENVDTPTDVMTADLDNDGDLDIVSASEDDNKIAWYENDGSLEFGGEQIITTDAAGARSIFAADLDSDGDIDILSASARDDKIAWYENYYINTDIEQMENSPNKLYLSQNFPNPFNPITTIEFSLKKNEHVHLNVYNTMGEKVATILNDFCLAGIHKIEFDGSNLPSGLYIYKINSKSFSSVRKMTLLR